MEVGGHSIVAEKKNALKREAVDQSHVNSRRLSQEIIEFSCIPYGTGWVALLSIITRGARGLSTVSEDTGATYILWYIVLPPRAARTRIHLSICYLFSGTHGRS